MFPDIRMTGFMLSCLLHILSCLSLCITFHIFLYVCYVHTCMFCYDTPYIHVHAYVYVHVSCSILCTHHSSCQHHSASILSQSDPAECGFSFMFMDDQRSRLCYGSLPVLRVYDGVLWALCLLVIPSSHVMQVDALIWAMLNGQFERI